jgi:tagaturonate reductase
MPGWMHAPELPLKAVVTVCGRRSSRFGTSRFLRPMPTCSSRTRCGGQAVGPVTVNADVGGGRPQASRRLRRAAAADRDPRSRGGQPVERTEHTTASSAASPGGGLGRGHARLCQEAEQVISQHRRRRLSHAEGETIGEGVPTSFPAKLTKLLHARWQAGAAPLTIFRTELVPDNGAVLRHAIAMPAAPACRSRSSAGSRRPASSQTASSTGSCRARSSRLGGRRAYALWAIRAPGRACRAVVPSGGAHRR